MRCSLPGKFKKEFQLKKDKLYHTDIAVVGDMVDIKLTDNDAGVITKIHPRKNYLSRKAPRLRGASYRGERLEQIIAANIDNLIIVSSIHEPEFNNKVIDRLLVAGESSHLNCIIIINKADLDDEDEIKNWVNLYKDLGYQTFITSIITKQGLPELNETLLGKKNIFWGQSGVGKSSILNCLYPFLNLKVGEISYYSEKGIHTTVTSTMIKVEDDTFIIDTPGIREIDPFGIRKEDLGHYFIEFSEYIPACRFNTCTHHHEPECAVIEAVENGEINLHRYESYLRILDTIEEDIIF